MTTGRSLSRPEKELLIVLLQNDNSSQHFIQSLDDLVVLEMADGGMGSLLLIPPGLESANRSFGRQLVAGEFTDTDGIPVSVTINLDRDGKLYELDVWKVNFTPLLSWPVSSDVRSLPVQKPRHTEQ